MSETMLDDSYGESMEYWGNGNDEGAEDYGEPDAEDYGDEGWYGGSDDAESAASRRRARERKRRADVLMARRKIAMRRAKARRPARRSAPPKTAAAAIKSTQAKVSNLNLETKVDNARIESALKSLHKRTKSNTQALVAIPVLNQISEQLDDLVPGLNQQTKDIINGVLRFGHVAVLPSSGPGFTNNPKYLAAAGGGAVIGLAALLSRLNDDTNGTGGGHGGMKITHYLGEIPVGGKSRFRTNADGAVTWTSDNDSVASVDADGLVTGKKPGLANITATRDKPTKGTATEGRDYDTVPVTVIQPPASK